MVTTLGGHVVPGLYTAADVKAEGCVLLDTIVGTKIRAMYVEHDHDHDHRQLASHVMDDEHADKIMINDATVILADISDGTSVFHGLDMVLLGSETFECPTDAPVAAPTDAPAADDEGAGDSSASFFGISVVFAAVAAVAAFVI